MSIKKYFLGFFAVLMLCHHTASRASDFEDMHKEDMSVTCCVSKDDPGKYPDKKEWKASIPLKGIDFREPVLSEFENAIIEYRSVRGNRLDSAYGLTPEDNISVKSFHLIGTQNNFERGDYPLPGENEYLSLYDLNSNKKGNINNCSIILLLVSID